MAKIPSYQRIVPRKLTPYFLSRWALRCFIAVIVTGSFLQSLDSAFSWIPSWVTYTGSLLIFIWWVFVKLVLRRWPIPWRSQGGILISLRAIKIEPELIGILTLLWLPSLAVWYGPLPPIPELDFLISSGRENEYVPGYEVNGLKWKNDFSKHIFTIRNKSKTVEAYNLRASLLFPGAILSYKERSKVGTYQINVRRIGITGAWYLDDQERVVASRTIYSNGIFIGIDKLSYESSLIIELIADLSRKDMMNILSVLDVKYHYSDNNRQRSFSKSEIYSIKKEDTRNALYIDKTRPLFESPLSFNYAHSFSSLLSENKDVDDVENKHFKLEVEYPFVIPSGPSEALR